MGLSRGLQSGAALGECLVDEKRRASIVLEIGLGGCLVHEESRQAHLHRGPKSLESIRGRSGLHKHFNREVF